MRTSNGKFETMKNEIYIHFGYILQFNYDGVTESMCIQKNWLTGLSLLSY